MNVARPLVDAKDFVTVCLCVCSWCWPEQPLLQIAVGVCSANTLLVLMTFVQFDLASFAPAAAQFRAQVA